MGMGTDPAGTAMGMGTDPTETYDADWAGELMSSQASTADTAVTGAAPTPTKSAPAATRVAPSVTATAPSPALPVRPTAAPTTRPPGAAPLAPVPVAPAPAAAIPAAVPMRGASFDWVSPLDTETGRIAHLLRRATFGATGAEFDRAMSEGYAKTVDRLLGTPPVAPPDLADGPSRNLQTLQQWWLDHMTTSPTPFAETMTLFWSGHFTSDYRKVGLQTPWVYWQNLSWRKMALADLRSMLKTVTIDPAMLRYLDLGGSTGKSPNENYSRELMELFTLGGGAFAEADVQAGAKALSGWRLPRPTETERTGIFDQTRAFTGSVTFLGKTARFDTDLALDQILAQDATAPFMVREVLGTFLSPFVSAGLVTRLAARFRASRWDVKALMRDVFLSPEFVAPEAYRSLVKSPVEFMVGAARALGQPLGRLAAASGSGMGQALFDPPSVAGWGSGPGLISSNTVIARANFVTGALAQVKPIPSAANAHTTAIDGVLGPQTVALLNATGDDRARWSVILSSPEFQLK